MMGPMAFTWWQISYVTIPLSNYTIQRRTLDISKNADKKLQNSNFALIGDESTDISNESQLFAFLYFTDEK